MRPDPEAYREEKLRQLERTICEAAGSARRARLLAERILHELTGAAAAARLCPQREDRDSARTDAGSETDAEPAWRLAA